MLERLTTKNRIIDLLPDAEFSRFSAHLTRVDVALGDIIARPLEQIDIMYFPAGAVFSLLVVMRDGAAVEAGTIGPEGCVGAQAFLGSDLTQLQTVCQVAGYAFKISRAAFAGCIHECPTLEKLIRRYLLGLMTFMSQSVACNRLHSLTERCARWLLTTHERVESNEFALTQDFLATMLGAHRPSVSLAASALQQAGYISYRYGRVTICDKAGLESVSCECYRVISDVFDRLISIS